MVWVRIWILKVVAYLKIVYFDMSGDSEEKYEQSNCRRQYNHV
jgi:hypothetical protein